ncbi:MAG: hypothetical protein NZ772_05765 [Cyanobacteria bacterium]|nr:hypothetical protein [Cyanobacteriota bacterium]
MTSRFSRLGGDRHPSEKRYKTRRNPLTDGSSGDFARFPRNGC